MLVKASINASLSLVALLMAQAAQAGDSGIDNRLIQLGAGGLLAYIILKLVLDYLRSRDAVKDRRVDDTPNNAIALSRELVSVLADIKVSLNDSRKAASEQHERQINLLTEIATRMRMQQD
jgi:hypothetical protein